VVGFGDTAPPDGPGRLVVTEREAETGRRIGSTTHRAPFHWVAADGVRVPMAIVSPSVADEVGLETTTTALAVSAPAIDEDTEAEVDEAVRALSRSASFTVERGYVDDETWLVILLILGALGGVLVLGGTLTATFLALSDARPDLATLSAVGAAPRTRRAVAAAFALVVGGVGAALGALLGFLPGIAVTYPLTGADWVQEVDPTAPDHFLDVPWLLVLTLVVGLPLLTAAIVGLAARSRLPMVARLD
jgi:putative ABC transport system permease protein